MRHSRQLCAAVARRWRRMRFHRRWASRRIRKSGGCGEGARIGIFVRRTSLMQPQSIAEAIMTTAYYSTVLNHPLETVWALIRDFNNYPAYIEGVSESAIEDNRRGDEVGAIR